MTTNSNPYTNGLLAGAAWNNYHQQSCGESMAASYFGPTTAHTWTCGANLAQWNGVFIHDQYVRDVVYVLTDSDRSMLSIPGVDVNYNYVDVAYAQRFDY